MTAFRIGQGYDAHRLSEGRRLILGGVHIPFEKGLLGHSDADVLTHAVIDSLLGALALGDIGKLFPDTDASFKDANSLQLLKKVAGIVSEQGYGLGNLDATILAEKPRLAGYILEMRNNLAATLGADVGLISVKATTEEGMGFTGRGEGITANAIVLLRIKTEPDSHC